MPVAFVISRIKANVISETKSSDEAAANLVDVGVSFVLLILACSMLLLFLAGILYSVVTAYVWPVEVKDLLSAMRGHPGYLFELACKCNRCGVSSIIF